VTYHNLHEKINEILLEDGMENLHNAYRESHQANKGLQPQVFQLALAVLEEPIQKHMHTSARRENQFLEDMYAGASFQHVHQHQNINNDKKA